MRRRWRLAAGLVLAVALVTGPAAAHDFTGSEEEERTLACPKPGEQLPEKQEPPGPGECPGKEPNETYQGKVWTNRVRCASGGQDIQAGKLYYTGDAGAMNGGIGICNENSPVPAKGRVVAQGSMASGLTVYADGTDANSPDQLKGWARADLSSSGGSFRCGADDGKQDATHPGAGDTQSSCG